MCSVRFSDTWAFALFASYGAIPETKVTVLCGILGPNSRYFPVKG